jgi:hypothetical protein
MEDMDCQVIALARCLNAFVKKGRFTSDRTDVTIGQFQIKSNLPVSLRLIVVTVIRVLVEYYYSLYSYFAHHVCTQQASECLVHHR